MAVKQRILGTARREPLGAIAHGKRNPVIDRGDNQTITSALQLWREGDMENMRCVG
jgi:hypothetical protein